jgi:hypothetical protein
MLASRSPLLPTRHTNAHCLHAQGHRPPTSPQMASSSPGTASNRTPRSTEPPSPPRCGPSSSGAPPAAGPTPPLPPAGAHGGCPGASAGAGAAGSALPPPAGPPAAPRAGGAGGACACPSASSLRPSGLRQSNVAPRIATYPGRVATDACGSVGPARIPVVQWVGVDIHGG